MGISNVLGEQSKPLRYEPAKVGRALLRLIYHSVPAVLYIAHFAHLPGFFVIAMGVIQLKLVTFFEDNR